MSRSARVALGFVGVTIVASGIGAYRVQASESSWGVFVRIASCFSTDRIERTACYERVLPELYPEHSTGELFATIRALQAYDDALLDCHFIAHRIGAAVVAHDPTTWASRMADDWGGTLCEYGFLHGIAIAFADDSSSPLDMNSAIGMLRAVCDDPPKTRIYIRNCFHASGHIFSTINDGAIRTALLSCDELVDGKDDEELSRLCYGGATMSLYFDADSAKIVERDPASARELCDTLDTPRHRAACLSSSWILSAETFLEIGRISEFCDELEPNYREGCYVKIVHGLAWRHITEPERIVPVCSGFPDERLREICHMNIAIQQLVTGGVSMTERAIAACESDIDSVTAACEHTLSRQGRFLYHDQRERRAFCSHFDESIRSECESLPAE